MNPADWPGGLAYFAVFAAAVLEGEVVFITASVLVSLGKLDALGVLVAGALGGFTGDQIVFYGLRGRVDRWLDRSARLAKYHQTVVDRVRRHAGLMALSCRFMPGLRIMIPAACAYAEVPALKFSGLDLLGAFGWAGSIMVVVAFIGPEAAERVGLSGWWGLLVPGATVFLFLRWLGRPPKG
ncbi:MAG: VTT domain-containing protein [Acidobacteria bacterium]|nr:VTT domain-containing protein [Acidobacteriota bacterium]